MLELRLGFEFFSQILEFRRRKSMLIEFTVGNYRSFKDRVTLSMVAENLVSKDKEIDESNIFKVDKKLSLLKSASIYGANASGKSNIAKALQFMKSFMLNSSRETQSTDDIEVEPFLLSTETEYAPSFFEIVFLLNSQRYRYGFEATTERVVSEWLYYVPKTRETNLFDRNSTAIKPSKTFHADGIESKTRQNALFLSVSAQFNVEIAEKILGFIKRNIRIISGLDNSYLGYSLECIAEGRYQDEILNFIKNLDLGINDVKVSQSELTMDNLPKSLPEKLRQLIVDQGKGKATSVKTSHRKFSLDGSIDSIIDFEFSDHESEGTQKILALAGPIVNTLKTGETLIVDELDAKLHPLLSHAIIKLFNSNVSNPNNAQLIFMTHDTNLLSNKVFRRDQIWFTEKKRTGETDLYSLAEYPVRNDASFESDYIKGKYGAVPYIGDLQFI